MKTTVIVLQAVIIHVTIQMHQTGCTSMRGVCVCVFTKPWRSTAQLVFRTWIQSIKHLNAMGDSYSGAHLNIINSVSYPSLT
jgi:hypothetical protein